VSNVQVFQCLIQSTEFDKFTREALETILDGLRAHAAEVIIQVLKFSDDDTVNEIGRLSRFELSGLYSSIQIGEKSASTTPSGVGVIKLCWRPVLDEWCETDEDLTRLIRQVLVHENGHHFGLFDVEIKRLASAIQRFSSLTT